MSSKRQIGLVISSLVFSSLLNLDVASANLYEKPKLISFNFTPNEVELNNGTALVDFTIKVSHPIGISSDSVLIRLQKRISTSSNIEFSTLLRRLDNPINKSLKEVTFSGKVSIPTETTPGVWNIVADPIKSYFSLGTEGWESDKFTPEKVRDLKNAESALLVRLNGDLNFDVQTFVGPTFNSDRYATDSLPINPVEATPILRAGEIVDLAKYFQLRVEGVQLNVATLTPEICTSTGTKLNLIKKGYCEYKVYTPKNSNYLYKEFIAGIEIKSPRIKPEIYIPPLSNVSVKGIPKAISRDPIYYGGTELIFPGSETPSICIPVGNEIKIFSGGICTLSYYIPETESRFASDKYFQTFEIIRDPQTITLTLPSTVNVSTRSISLAATASSGGAITYSTASAGICSITGSTLNLLRNGNCAVTATQAGTSTFAPASATATVVLSGAAVSNRKTITCVKGKSTKRVSGVNPKCPRGFKIKS
jgi:hypothetical protein